MRTESERNEFEPKFAKTGKKIALNLNLKLNASKI